MRAVARRVARGAPAARRGRSGGRPRHAPRPACDAASADAPRRRPRRRGARSPSRRGPGARARRARLHDELRARRRRPHAPREPDHRRSRVRDDPRARRSPRAARSPRGSHAAASSSCAKHFPGHGDTTVDSHLALPRVERPKAELERIEIASFRALAKNPAIDSMMTAHVVYPALDPEQPATLSRAICTDLLRTELGFEGVLFSDDLEMKALTMPTGEAAVRAVTAGCDVLLVCSRADLAAEAHEALVREAERSPAFRARCEEAFARALAMRRRVRPAPLTDRSRARPRVRGHRAGHGGARGGASREAPREPRRRRGQAHRHRGSGTDHARQPARRRRGRRRRLRRALDQLDRPARRAPRRSRSSIYGDRVITPGLVDAHTHAAWVGSRHDEYAMRMAGADYRAIAAAGGGILSSYRADRGRDRGGDRRRARRASRAGWRSSGSRRAR